MPRKKYDTPHRSRVVKTRMTEEEYADFAARLAPYGISQSEFIRRAIQGASIRPVVTVSPVNDELLAALGKLTAEYGRIGNNLNQIARAINDWHNPYPQLVAAVGLKLRFAGALRADGALARRARLTLQMRPHTDQARQQVLILRELDLKSALFCLRPLGENVENQPAAVEHLHAELFAQNAHLRGREVIVEDDHCRLL